MDKVLVANLTKRCELVGCRLKALETERISLLEEKEALLKLIGVYNSRGEYDSIEEERRVTRELNGLNNSNNLVEIPKIINKGRASKYTFVLEEVYKNNKNTLLTMTELTKVVNNLMGTNIVSGTMYNVLKGFIRNGIIQPHITENGTKVYGYINK